MLSFFLDERIVNEFGDVGSSVVKVRHYYLVPTHS